MPDVSGASAVNTCVHTHYPIAHTGLRVHWAPGIPRALFDEGDEISGQARARIAPRDRDVLFRDVLFEDVLFQGGAVRSRNRRFLPALVTVS
jgi:hypothetical protein